MRTLPFLIASALLSGCVKSAALNTNYDLGKVRRIGVAAFGAPAGAAGGVEDLFAKHLLDQGYQVVERSRLDAVVKELNLGLQGYLPPESAKRIGQVLGVDALLLGEITSFSPERKSVVMAENRAKIEEPVIKTVREKNPDGTFSDVPRQVGTTVRQEKTQVPQTFVIDAQVGVVAKLVDAETGELIWAGSDAQEAVNPHFALDQAAASLARKLRKQWDMAAKNRRTER